MPSFSNADTLKNKHMAAFNLNTEIKVRIKDAGIEHYVRNFNKLVDIRNHISFREFKSRADENGYHSMAMWSLIDDFGANGLRLSNLIDIEIEIPDRK